MSQEPSAPAVRISTRGVAAPVSAPPAAAPAATSFTPAIPAGEAEKRFAQARARRDEQAQRQMALLAKLELTESQVAQCQKEAEAFGVGSLEDLQAKIAQMEAEESERLQSFEAALERQGTQLDDIEQQLGQIS